MATAASSPSAGRASRSGRRRVSGAGRATAVVPAVLALVLTGCSADGQGAALDDTAPSSDIAPSSSAEQPVAEQPQELADPASTDASADPDGQGTGLDDDEALLTAAPDDFSEVGTLVEDFPIDLLPIPSDAVILVTSAVPVGDAAVQEISLNLRTSAPAAALVTLYRDALLAAGFTEVPSSTVPSGLAAETTFTRSAGDELVSVGILDADGSRTVTIGGRVHTTS